MENEISQLETDSIEFSMGYTPNTALLVDELRTETGNFRKVCHLADHGERFDLLSVVGHFGSEDLE